MSTSVYCEKNEKHNDMYDFCAICEIEELKEQIEVLQSKISSEFNRGYNEGKMMEQRLTRLGFGIAVEVD